MAAWRGWQRAAMAVLGGGVAAACVSEKLAMGWDREAEEARALFMWARYLSGTSPATRGGDGLGVITGWSPALLQREEGET